MTEAELVTVIANSTLDIACPRVPMAECENRCCEECAKELLKKYKADVKSDFLRKIKEMVINLCAVYEMDGKSIVKVINEAVENIRE